MHYLINCETWTKIEIEGKQRPVKQGTVKWKWCHTEPSVRHSCCSWTEFKESVSSCHFMATRLHIQTQLHVDTLIQALNSCSGKKIATGTGWVTLGIKARVKTKQLPPASIFPLFPPLSTHATHIIMEKNTVLQPCRLHGVHSSLLSYISNHIYDHLQPTIKKRILYITVCSQLKAFNCLLIDKCRSAIISSNAGQFWGWTHC